MKRAIAGLVIVGGVLLRAGSAHASGIGHVTGYAEGMAQVFGIGLELGLIVPLTLAAVETGRGERLSEGHGLGYAAAGTILGGVGVIMIANSGPAETDRGPGWLSATLTPSLLALGGLGFGSLASARPRDAWIGAVGFLSAFEVAHASLAWTGRGGTSGAMTASAIFSLAACGGGLALAATADDPTEAVALYSVSGLSAAASVTQFVLLERRQTASNTSARQASWVVAPSLTARGQTLTLQGTF